MSITLSIFLNEKKCYAATEKADQILTCDKIQSVSDVFVPMLSEFWREKPERVLFPIGPGSFTSIRVVNSIIKGLAIATRSKDVSFISLSSFLTFFFVIPPEITSGIIAISTMRGDYFCMNFQGSVLDNNNFRILSETDLSNESSVFKNNDPIFENVNLAKVQLENINSTKALANSNLIGFSREPVYGFSPNYSIKQ